MNRTFKQTTLLISCLTLFSSLVCLTNHSFNTSEISATDNERLTSSCSVLFPAIDDSDMKQLFLIKEDDDGNKIYSGYYGDLFSSISQTASININYIVPKDAEETGEMISDFLLHGSENKYNIDISPNISSSFYNNSDKYKVDFVDTPDLRSPVHLYTRSDEKTISEFDYSTYYGKTVGITYVYKQATSSYEPTSRDSYFFPWAAINGLYDELNPDDSPLKVNKYYSEEERNLALQNGDVDIIVEKHSLVLEDVRTLTQIGEINSYVGCASGLTDLYQKLDSTMKKLEADSSEYFSTLCDKWHPTNYKYVILNDSEKELIANKKLDGGFTIGYPKTVFPFIMEKENDTPYGVLPDYLSYCEDYLDVNMKLEQHSDAEKAIQDLKDGKIDFWFARNANHNPDEFLDTETYLNIDERFIVNRNNLLTFEEAKKIGCYSFDGVGTEFENRLTNYKDYEQMFKDLNEGKLDGIITSLGLYNYAKYTLRFDNLINQGSVGKTNLVFFSSPDAVIAHGILNKCIFALTNDGVDQILLEKYELQIDFHYTTGDFLQQNAIILIVSAIVLIISLSLLLFIFLFRNSKIRKYNSE